MTWIIRILLFLVGGVILICFTFAMCIIFMLTLVRWIFTGQKPELFFFIDAIKEWKFKNSYTKKSNSDDNVIDVDFTEEKNRSSEIQLSDTKKKN